MYLSLTIMAYNGRVKTMLVFTQFSGGKNRMARQTWNITQTAHSGYEHSSIARELAGANLQIDRVSEAKCLDCMGNEAWMFLEQRGDSNWDIGCSAMLLTLNSLRISRKKRIKEMVKDTWVHLTIMRGHYLLTPQSFFVLSLEYCQQLWWLMTVFLLN